MKKIITTFLFSFFAVMCFAQTDTLLWENFDQDVTLNPNGNFQHQVQPPAATNDQNWYNWDQDGLADQSGQSRPGEWFWAPGGFADVDSGDGCMFSNSWTNDPNTPVENYLITPALQIIDGNAVVHWKSATRQTPRYLDGYKVMVSTTDNDVNSFTNQIFRAAEMTALPSASADTNAFSSYAFGPAGTWIQGIDGTYVQDAGDSSRLIGIQKDTSASLAAFNGQTIYIAFVHYTFDDNLLSLDDILVTGTNPNGFDELTRDPLQMYAYPNPADRNTMLNFTLTSASHVTVRVTDIVGNEMLKRQVNGVIGKNSMPLNAEELSGGTYFYTVTSGTATSTGKFVVIK
jgi:hypothetical protein